MVTSILHSERGATLVYVALSSFVLLMFLGLATDTGLLVWVRTQGQKRVDAAALAAARALVEQDPVTRQTKAEALADEFGDRNFVATSNNSNPDNSVMPMHFEFADGKVTEQPNWSPGIDGTNCNAVKVATMIPTPVFFAGVRSFISGAAEAATNISVSAVAHLPCPGLLVTAGAKLAPLALRQGLFSTAFDCEPLTQQNLFPSAKVVFTTLGTNSCDAIATGLYPSSLDPEIKVGETIDIIAPPTSCLDELKTRYQACDSIAKCDNALFNCKAVVPIIDGGGTVAGFASVCFTGFDPPIGTPTSIHGSLACNEYPSGAGGAGGDCLGTYARTPILVQ